MIQRFDDRRTRLSRRRLGFTMIEVVVACGILTTVISVLATLAYRNQRTWQMLHQRQIAQDELFALGHRAQQTAGKNATDIQSLALSPHASDALPEADLKIEVQTDDLGSRVQFDLNWKRISNPPPIRYTVWIPASERDS